MAFLKSKSASASSFRVPSLAEADAEYASLLERQNSLNAELGQLGGEQSDLQAKVAADQAPEIRPAIAELLGDAPSSKSLMRQRLAEIERRKRDIEVALDVLRERIRQAESRASRAACDAIRPEYARRVSAMIAAMRALDTAHSSFNDLCLEIEAGAISYGYLGPAKPFFLGSARDPDRKIARYLKEAKEAGYDG